MKPEIYYFLSHPIQYFTPLLRALAQKFALRVYYFSDASIRGLRDAGFGQQIKWDTPLLEGYDSTFIHNWAKPKPINNRIFDVFNPGVLSIIRKSRNKILVINDWKYSSTLLIIFFGKLYGNKVWLRAENPLINELAKNKRLLGVKQLVLKNFVFKLLVDKFLYIGKESKKFFQYYGVPDEKLVFTPYSVDNDFFAQAWEKMKNETPEIRKELGLPADKKIILYCGKYMQIKRPMDLLRAFHRLNRPDYALVMVGEGECRQEMEAYIAEHQLKDVYLTGFVNQSAIPKYYAVCDVFVLCSQTETWGLAANEAMNFEKPVILSHTCGCGPDLVENGTNGYVFQRGNTEELANVLRLTLDDPNFCRLAGRRSKEIVNYYSPELAAENIVQAALDTYSTTKQIA